MKSNNLLMEQKERKINFYRHVPMWFSYIHCDDLARYLEDQARNGWKFRGFRMGLEFEKAMPESVQDDVLVFAKNTEMDTRPEPDTEEFADYCAAAGWEFIDSSRKFVVFKKIRQDAAPIFTEEEKFKSVWKAEMSFFWMWYALYLMWVGIVILNLKNNFDTLVFGHNGLLYAYAIWIIEAIIATIRLPFLIKWKVENNKAAEMGEKISFEGNIKAKFLLESRRLIFVMGLFAFAFAAPKYSYIWIALIGASALSFGIAWFRPSREENWIVQIAGSLLLFFLIATLVISSSFSDDGKRKGYEQSSLKIEDIMEVKGEPSYLRYDYNKTIFGSREELSCTYNTPGYEEAKIEWHKTHSESYPADEGEQYLGYTVYTSKYDSIIDKTAEKNLRRIQNIFKDNLKDVSNEWGADWAYYYTTVRFPSNALYNHTYLVRFENTYVTLTVHELLSSEQISIIKGKLGL